mgnify:CR=1 FL=1
MLVIVGSSASGKTKIVQELIKTYHMEKLVTYTTREKRIGEIEGKDYHFISREDFIQKIKNNFFIEYVEYNNNYYGTSFSDLSVNKVVILEPQGLSHYLKVARELVTIVFLKTSPEVLRIRMLNRGDAYDDVMRRVKNDQLVFNQNVKNLADLVVDTTPSNIYHDAEIIYNFYKKRNDLHGR